MKELIVASGKGGTGKTSFAAALAALSDRPVALADCDVDAANLALLLPGEDSRKRPFYAGHRARVETEACSGCGDCVNVCRFYAIFLSGGKARTDDLLCEGCRACSVVCPEDAIRFADNRIGWIGRRDTSVGPLVHAELGIAQDTSGKLVTEVRRLAREVAEENGAELLIVDGPPGIGCPLHAAITGSSMVLAVTEPTPSAAGDLERLLDVCDHFGRRVVVAVNKSDLDDGDSERLRPLEDREAPIVGRVPFDEEVPRALARRELPLVVEDVSAALGNLWRRIESEISSSPDAA